MSERRPPGTPSGDRDIYASPQSVPQDIPATLMDGRYRIARVIGKGAFGRVYLAFDERLRRNVAIKELLARRSDTPDDSYARYLERFEREARAAGVVQHPNIVAVLELAIDTDNNYYLIMEYIDGTNLRDLLSQVRSLPVERAVRITLEIAQALDAVHERDIVHRDLKPANIMLTRRGVAKVADFGVAQVGHESQRTQIARGHPGTPLYMSPEQGASRAYIDGRSDLYSLGLIFYEMLTGVPYARHQRPLDEMLPDLSPDLVAVFARLTEKEPRQRYTYASEVVAALSALTGTPTAQPLPPDLPLPPRRDSPSAASRSYPPLPSVASAAASQPPPVTRSQRETASVASGPGSAGSQPPAPFTPEPIAPPAPAPAARRGGRGLLFGSLGLVLVAGIAAAAFLLVRGGERPAPPTPTITPTGPIIAARQEVTPTVGVPPSPEIVVTPTRQATVPAAVTPTGPPTAAATNVTDFSQWATTEVAGLYRRSYDAGAGEYHVTLLRDNAVEPILSPEPQRLSDLTIEVDVRHVAGPDAGGYGLAFRVQPLAPGTTVRAAYYFLINGQQQYAFYERSSDGSVRLIQPLTPLPAGVAKIGPNAVNHLAATCVGDQITVALNGTTLNTYIAKITQPGTVGIVVTTPASVSGVETAFRNLRVTVAGSR